MLYDNEKIAVLNIVFKYSNEISSNYYAASASGRFFALSEGMLLCCLLAVPIIKR